MSARYACCKHCPRLNGAPCAPKGGHAQPCHATRIISRLPYPTCVAVPFEEATDAVQAMDRSLDEGDDRG